MTITDQIKIKKKNMQNEAQYDLDRKADKISALSSNTLDKYQYLTGEDLGLSPNTIKQAISEYSQLVKIFNKGLSKNDKEEGLFKRLKHIENAQKSLIRDDDKDKKQQTNSIDRKPSNIFNYSKRLIPEANDLMDEIGENDDDIDLNKLAFIGSNQEKFHFNTFRMSLNFLQGIYHEKISLKEAEFKQRDFEKKIDDLKFGYKLKDKKEKEEKLQVLLHANDLLESRNKIIKALKMIFFRLNI